MANNDNVHVQVHSPLPNGLLLFVMWFCKASEPVKRYNSHTYIHAHTYSVGLLLLLGSTWLVLFFLLIICVVSLINTSASEQHCSTAQQREQRGDETAWPYLGRGPADLWFVLCATSLTRSGFYTNLVGHITLSDWICVHYGDPFSAV